VGSPGTLELPTFPAVRPHTKRRILGTRVERVPTHHGGGRVVFHPRPTSTPLRPRENHPGTWVAPTRWNYPRSPPFVLAPSGGHWGRGWSASLPITGGGRVVFHPRPTSIPGRPRENHPGTWVAPARWNYPRSPPFVLTPDGGDWGRGWNASLPITGAVGSCSIRDPLQFLCAPEKTIRERG
jgi:hypothetical protein